MSTALGRVYQPLYTDLDGDIHIVGVPAPAFEIAEARVRSAQALQTQIFGVHTIQWPTYISEIELDLAGRPSSTINVTEVPWS